MQKRRQSRILALQALYQWDFTHHHPETIIAQFLSEKKIDTQVLDYFKILLQGTIIQVEALDEQLTPCLDRSLKSLNPVEHNILRLALFELINHLEIPSRVIINEAVEIAKDFGADQSYKYINAVLDRFSQRR